MTVSARPARVDGWRLLDGGPTPFQSLDWYAAAGRLGGTKVVAVEGAAAPLWLAGEDEHPFHSPRAQVCGPREEPLLAGAEDELAAARAAEWGPAAVTISPYGYRGGAVGEEASLARLADDLAAAAEATGARLLVSHFLYEPEDAAWIDALVSLGGAAYVLGADAVLGVEWPTMDAYYEALGAARSSNRRRAAAAAREPVELRVRDEPGLPPEHPDAVGVLAATMAAHDPRTPPPRRLLESALEGRAFPRLLATVASPGGPLRSVGCVLSKGSTLYPKFFGTRKPRADYLRISFDWLVGHAIEHGYRRIEYGGGAHEAKLMRGARLRYSIGVFVFFDDELRAAVEPVARRLSAAKLRRFGELSARWHLDDLPSPPPRAVEAGR